MKEKEGAEDIPRDEDKKGRSESERRRRGRGNEIRGKKEEEAWKKIQRKRR